jgi:hypothetical protein
MEVRFSAGNSSRPESKKPSREGWAFLDAVGQRRY